MTATTDFEKKAALHVEAKGDGFEAIISTPAPDYDGDIVQPTAFKNGQSVPLLIAHNWASLPIGTAKIHVTPRDARASLTLFDTTAGKEAATALKGLGSLAEFSIGYTPVDFGYNDVAGKRIRTISALELHEISYVLKGASRGTGLVSAPKAAELAAMRAAHEATCERCQMKKRAEFLFERYG